MSACTTEYITIITSITITSTASTSIVYLPSLEYSSIVKSELNGYIIDKLYTQIGKVFRLPWELNLLLSCFGILAMYSRIYWNSWPSLQAWHPSTVYGRGQLGSIWLKTSWLPAFSDLAILFIYGVHSTHYTVLIREGNYCKHLTFKGRQKRMEPTNICWEKTY